MLFRSRKRGPAELLAELDRSTAERLADPAVDRRLLAIRHRAGVAMVDRAAPGGDHPAPAANGFSAGSGVPEVSRRELSPEVLRGAILSRGCLLVRGLVDADAAAELRDAMDRAFGARDAARAGRPAPDGWFEEFVPDARYDLGQDRLVVSDPNGMWLADSPHVTGDWFDLLGRAGFLELAAGYLGERPAISVNKSTLRRLRVDPAANFGASFWHQDGAFLGPVRALNLWLSLSHCGVLAPGLDVVPRRIDHIVATGTEGATFPWSVSQAVAEQQAAGDGIARPEFAPGDALLFDELFLHGTALSAEMTETRYAVECWFFSPSAFPADYPPLAS